MSSFLRVALVSFHSSPVAAPGSGNAGGMNVFIYNLSRSLGLMGISVDIFTRCTDPSAVGSNTLFPNVRVINLFDSNTDKEKSSLNKDSK